MVPVVAYILHDDDCYSGKYGEEVFDLLEAWYWINLFLDNLIETRIHA